ncbi:hypothetical protein VITFI_CDS1564 [Vitreoscilla filiformis]|uniref:Uncharacterized protein n=1 Tax=Vitreoscilla filiformis TaxID=63 RepID=A0A221KE81_VITFI|nr:hypothetical protein VITFI_CDS1564 [Vitreoscilla filiformis]
MRMPGGTPDRPRPVVKISRFRRVLRCAPAPFLFSVPRRRVLMP